jgi:pimeloyl-ACP methyl ester carboxylesterase
MNHQPMGVATAARGSRPVPRTSRHTNGGSWAIARCAVHISAGLMLGACSSSSSATEDPLTTSKGDLHTVDAGSDAGAAARLANDVILVHGAFADGSSWSGVIERLQSKGFSVRAVQLSEQSLAADVALVRHEIESLGRPVIVAAHSYGGAVMSQATAGATNVVGLVFVAAFAPDEGETLHRLLASYPPPPALAHLVVDDQGNATIPEQDFLSHFAPDVPLKTAQVAFAVQHPIAGSILDTPAAMAAWKTIPTFYQVSTQDQAIPPDLERFFAARMGAQTIELASSHVSLMSHPDEVAGLITRAAEAK